MRLLFPALALAMVQLGCSGSDSTIAGDDAGSADGTTDGSTSETGADAGGGTDAADATTTTDSGADAADSAFVDGAVDGGVLPAPGKVSCGATSCVSPAVCCAQVGGGTSCQTGGGGCAGGALRECDEAADCPLAQVCCYERTATGLSSSCHADCTGGGGARTQACRVAGECLTGSCAVHACSSDAGAASVETCAPIVGVCP